MFRLTSFVFLLFILILSVNCSNSDDDASSTVLPETLIFEGAVFSCDNFTTSILLDDDENSNISLTVTIPELLPLPSSGFDSFFYELPDSVVSIEINVWDSSVSNLLCNDMNQGNSEKLETWTAVSGEVLLSGGNNGVSLLMENLVFENRSGQQRTIASLRFIANPFGGFTASGFNEKATPLFELHN